MLGFTVKGLRVWGVTRYGLGYREVHGTPVLRVLTAWASVCKRFSINCGTLPDFPWVQVFQVRQD